MSAAHASPFVTALGTASLLALVVASFAVLLGALALAPLGSPALSLPSEVAFVAAVSGAIGGALFGLIACLLTAA